jgi:hypothetical protein
MNTGVVCSFALAAAAPFGGIPGAPGAGYLENTEKDTAICWEGLG